MVYKVNEYVLYIFKVWFVVMGMVEWNFKFGLIDCMFSMVEWCYMIGFYVSCKIIVWFWFLI